MEATKRAYHLEEIKPGERFEVYRCKYCLAYHIGHDNYILTLRFS